MQRREFIAAVGTAAAVVSASRSIAAETPTESMHPAKYKALEETTSRWIPEVNQDPIAHVLRHEPAEALHGIRDGLLVDRNHSPQVFRVHARGQSRRPDEVREHHCYLAALGAVFGRSARGTGRGRCVNRWRLDARVATQSGDGIQQLHTVPNRRDAKLLQGLVRQARKNRLVYVVLAERLLVLPKAKAPQPDHNVHDENLGFSLHHITAR
jgi:hypothetical protein